MPFENCNMSEEHRDTIANELIPLFASIVDKYGGLCRMDVVCNQPDVRALRGKLPSSKDYKIQQILSQEPEFFTLFDDGDKVATALAYEDALVDADARITESGFEHLDKLKAQFRDEKENYSARGASQDGSAGQRVSGRGASLDGSAGQRGRAPVSAQRSTTITAGDKRQMSQKLTDAFLSGSAADFDAVVRDARRMKARFVPAGRGNPAPVSRSRNTGPPMNAKRREPLSPRGDREPKMLRNEELPDIEMIQPDPSPQQLREIERMMRICVELLRNEPDQTCILSKLADDTEIKGLKQALNGAPFRGLFDSCYAPHFQLDKSAANQMFVKMLDEPHGGSYPPIDIPMVRKDSLHRGGHKTRGGANRMRHRSGDF